MKACARPRCQRPRANGIHCRKCHRSWAISQHNLGRDHGGGIGPPTWPAYDQTMTIAAFLDRLIDAFS